MAINGSINQIVQENIDKNKFHAWKFCMTNFWMGKGYWHYVEGEHDLPPLVLAERNTTPEKIKALKDWNQGSQKVMYWIFDSIHDTKIGHIKDVESPKEAWDELVK